MGEDEMNSDLIKVAGLALLVLLLSGCLGLSKQDPNIVCPLVWNGTPLFDQSAYCEDRSGGAESDVWCMMAVCYDPTNSDNVKEYAEFANGNPDVPPENQTPPNVYFKSNLLCHRSCSFFGCNWEYIDPPSKSDAYNNYCTDSQTCEVAPDPDFSDYPVAACKDIGGGGDGDPVTCTPDCSDSDDHACNALYTKTYPDTCANKGDIYECTGTKVCPPQVFAQGPRKYIFDPSDTFVVRGNTADNPDNYDNDPLTLDKGPEPPPEQMVNATVATYPLGPFNYVTLDTTAITGNGAHAWGVKAGTTQEQLLRSFTISSPNLPQGTGAYYGVLSTGGHLIAAPSFVFSVQTPSANQCMSPSGIPGTTGATAVPNILLSWNWGHVSKTECGETGKYCDSTQLMLVLMQQLQKLDDAINGQNGKPYEKPDVSLTTFNLQLVQDGLTQDFRNDFDQYAKDNSGALALGVPSNYATTYSDLVTKKER
ncbi:MAG: hypothetical protein Q7R47_01690, partial [Candidatus Diapherotrites archaeon]|nr:hypothetical protein [Candidatus Diapherotrites archaeon]